MNLEYMDLNCERMKPRILNQGNIIQQQHAIGGCYTTIHDSQQ